MAEIPNVRRLSDVLIHLRLKDNGVAVDFTSLSDIRTLAYSDSQKAVAGPCPCEIDEEDSTILNVRYNVDVHQYLGIAKIVLRCTYQGRTKTYDVPVLNFVDTTAEATGVLVLPDPEISVELEVADVSTSLLDDAINAAFAGADLAYLRADEASSAAAGAAEAATLAREKAQAANSAAGRANSSATNANNAAAAAVAATESIQELETAIEEAETAREERADADHERAETDHDAAADDHERAGDDHSTASDDHTQAGTDHGRAADDHSTATDDHTTAGSDHTRAESDHTTAASDHSTASSDHETAEADHAIVQGYDTRLTNVEGEVSQLGQDVAELYAPSDIALEMNVYGRRWENVDGKVALSAGATSATSYKAVPIKPFAPFTVSTSESGTSAVPYFITDEQDNILVEGSGSQPQTISGIAPQGAAKIYINSVTNLTGYPALLLGESVFEHLHELDGKVKDWVFILRGIVDSEIFRDGMSPQVGDLFYQTDTKKFYRCTGTSPLTYEVISPRINCIYVYGQNLYAWNGTALVSAFTEQVIYIKVFAAASPAGLSEGEYYYNTNDKKLRRRLTGQYYNTIVPLQKGTIYIYNDTIYLYNGTELFSPITAEAEQAVQNHFDLELPILAPSPQLPANDAQEADFNAETVTSADIHNALDSLIASIGAPASGVQNAPKYLTKYEESGLDSSGVFPIYTYAAGLRNRFAWRYANELYAWKDGNDNIVYINSCSPRAGDTIYSDAARTDSGKTVASYNSGTGTMVDSASASYTRSGANNVPAVMFWTKRCTLTSESVGANIGAFNRSDVSLGNATYIDATHLSFDGKTYIRSECFDYHSEQKGTIFIWGNEHGPTSDPLEPSIIIYRLAKDLCGGCRNNPFLAFIKQYFKVVFIPCANPWGCQYPRVNGRLNSNGVNINRNYDTPGWVVVADTDKGNYAGDQNETQYIMNMCKRFAPDISIDIHCLGFGNNIAEGLMYLSETAVPDNAAYLRTQKVMSGLGYFFDQRGIPMPESGSHGSEWLDYNDMIGGVFEMNPGPYSQGHIYDGKQHSASVMEADYTELLNCIRMWMAEFDASIDLTKMSLK